MEKKNEEFAKTIGAITIIVVLITLTIASVSVIGALWFFGFFCAIAISFILFVIWHSYTQIDSDKNEE
ncbi:hypothetical protein LCGC14_1519490 [marine sediment metagenome]|uniref:Uncharacterized protein n=1 Tax=marine sediment metagenome TaxID=412755 RepID=A0A0F9JJW9_9ZZZZ